MKNQFAIMTALGVALVGVTSSVQALPTINGSFDIEGTLIFVPDSYVFESAVGISSVIAEVTPGSETGDYPGSLDGDAVNVAPFSFNPLSGTPDIANIAPLLGPTYDFNVTSATIQEQFDGYLNISGAGTAYITGYAPTYGTWSLTVTGFDENTPPYTALPFGADFSVPDGGTTVGLLGLGLGACALYTRRMTKLA
jgi:hypothetical protein